MQRRYHHAHFVPICLIFFMLYHVCTGSLPLKQAAEKVCIFTVEDANISLLPNQTFAIFVFWAKVRDTII